MKSLLLVTAALSTYANSALAADAPVSPHQWSGTATAISDYVFRGLTQTWGKPALQGSIDYAHPSGVYASLWASTLSKKVIAGASSEIDVALGYKGSLGDWGYSAGLLSVLFPGGDYNKLTIAALPSHTYDFNEANVSLSYKWLSLKYSRTLNDLLGFDEQTGFTSGTTGSGYTELNADVALFDSAYVLGLHIGRQNIKALYADGRNPDFTDYRMSVSRQVDGGWIGAVHLTKNGNTTFFNATPSNYGLNDTRDVGKRRFAVSVTKLF